MVLKESLVVLKIIDYLIKMEFIEMIHQQHATKLQNGRIQTIYNAGEVVGQFLFSSYYSVIFLVLTSLWSTILFYTRK